MSLRPSAIAIASLALHAGFFVVLAGLPEPVRVEPDREGWTPIEIVPWRGDDAARPGSPIAATRTEPDTRGVTDTAAVAVPEIGAPQPRPSTSRPRAAKAEPLGEHAAEPAPTPIEMPEIETPRAGTQPAENALALRGLRDLGSEKASLPAPRVSASALGGGTKTPAAPLPEPPPSENDRGIPRTLGDAGFVRDKQGNMIYRAPAGNFVAKMLPDGRVHFDDKIMKPSMTRTPAPDLYTIVRKAQKRELWARDKAELLKRTFDLRLAVAIAFAEGNIDRRIKELYRDLIGIWSDHDRLPVARRKTLFERWDECDESMRVKLPGFEDATHSRIDDLRQTAGQRARDKIDEFIRKHLPAGSDDAYPREELAELNRARVSRQKFAPYDVKPDEKLGP